jgi:hypothetical protein
MEAKGHNANLGMIIVDSGYHEFSFTLTEL